MEKGFGEMNRNEMLKAVKYYELSDKLTEKAAELDKKVGTLKNAEILEVLRENVIDPGEGDEKGDGEAGGSDAEAPEIDTSISPEEREEFGQYRRMVVITDHNMKVTSEETIKGRTFPVTIGNTNTGRTTHHIKLDGEPQPVANAVIRKMETIMMTKVITDNTSKSTTIETIPRFRIADAAPITQAELDAIAEEQKGRIGLNV